MAAAKPVPTDLDAIVGGNVRRHRERLGASHDDLAQALRDRGWRASGPMLVALERGKRGVRFEEAFLLADALAVPVASLLETEQQVRLGWLLPQQGSYLIDRLTTSRGPGMSGEIPEDWEVLERVRRGSHLSTATRAGIPTRGHSVGDESMREAERHAATRLGISPEEVVRRSRELWGRTLSEERDALASARTRGEATKRHRTAVRAHVSRELLGQLRAHIKEEST